MSTLFIDSLLLGAVSGLFAGLFGIGGGLIIVPVLAWLFTSHNFDAALVMIMAVATSLATIVFTSIGAVLTHYRQGSILLNKVWRLIPGILIGSGCGAVVADFISVEWLRVSFIVYLVVVAMQLAMQTQPKPSRMDAGAGLDHASAFFIGLLSSILGIGGGTLIVPYLVYFQIPMRNAVAISSACGLPIAIAGSLSYAMLGSSASNLPEWSFGYIYLPAFLGIILTSTITASWGAMLANVIPAQRLKRYFSILLMLMAAKMIWF